MSGRIGVELGPGSLRAVRLDGWTGRRARAVEADWDLESPAQAVRELREHLGRARRVGVAVRLPLLLTKRVRLPPLPPAERRNMLRLEPHRYFPVRLEDLVVAIRPDDLVFAAREASLSEWVRALEELGPVDVVEPGPVALTRGLGRAGVSDGTAVLDESGGGFGLVEIRGGKVARVRRMYGSRSEAAAILSATDPAAPRRVYLCPWSDELARELAVELPGAVFEPLPDVGAVPGSFLSAYGAALGIGRDLGEALVPDDLRGRIVARRWRDFAVAATSVAAALAFALVSADARRERTVERVSGQVRSLTARATPALALQSEVQALDRQTRALAQIQAERPDPLEVLLAISRRLPPGATLRTLRLAESEWQLDGYARQAGEVTRALGGAPEFRDVRLLSATNRAQVGDRIYETFAVSFRFVPPS